MSGDRWVGIAVRGTVFVDERRYWTAGRGIHLKVEPHVLQYLKAVRKLGFKIRMHRWEGEDANFLVRSLDTAGVPWDEITAAHAKPDELFYFDAKAFGWPGWAEALNAVSGVTLGLIEELDDDKKLPPGTHVISSSLERQYNSWCKEIQRVLVGSDAIMISQLQGVEHVLDQSPIATPEVAEELMFEHDAGRLLTIEEHARCVAALQQAVSAWTETKKRVTKLAANISAHRASPMK